MLQLRCAAQNYDWGRKYQDSEVAKLAHANGNEVDESKPFAELWMGAHPNGPSKVAATGESLASLLAAHPAALLGARVAEHFGQLPYLFKVLSVSKALSIQSHPDKQLAERLHAEHPKMYADPNHKPEMALALSDFEALCGFSTTAELQARLAATPELAGLVGAEQVAALAALPAGAAGQDHPAAKQALKSAFTHLMTAPPAAVTEAVRSLVARLEAAQAAGAALSEHEALALRLNAQFPDDVGIFSAFFLNIVRLPAGSAIYLPANEPHAYLAGELVECMAASDNVIRAGLTPKFKHADVLCESLTYRQGLPDVLEGSPAGPGGSVRVYQPPFEEFELQKLEVSGGEVALAASQGPRILLVTAGEAEVAAGGGGLPAALEAVKEVERGGVLRRGSIVLLAPGVEFAVRRAEELVGWMAAVNSAFFAIDGAKQGAAAGTGAAEEEKEVATV
ncbi:hypothetical protein CHLRE_02g147650v5 [Chlamydomonas reinhardtii]|uniref:Mannose-6-phosphate isomerase n=1 Tax=Chlamydomonas reinhardtii TaxID=3055 RepID=A0A2K3E3M9_CHLRE|nr:uncharacterized protein CHLRE_02g147650v5 [Chlamydomonas reinhardtii]PNW87389.1 hypothetical protein CHLRE_02g147650v5 [Chlamydomonas reinhardtii]